MYIWKGFKLRLKETFYWNFLVYQENHADEKELYTPLLQGKDGDGWNRQLHELQIVILHNTQWRCLEGR